MKMEPLIESQALWISTRHKHRIPPIDYTVRVFDDFSCRQRLATKEPQPVFQIIDTNEHYRSSKLSQAPPLTTADYPCDF